MKLNIFRLFLDDDIFNSTSFDAKNHTNAHTHAYAFELLMRLWWERVEGKQTIKIKKKNVLPSNLIPTNPHPNHSSRTKNITLHPPVYHQVSWSGSHVCVFVAKFKNGTKKFITLLIILRGFKSFTPEVGRLACCFMRGCVIEFSSLAISPHDSCFKPLTSVYPNNFVP